MEFRNPFKPGSGHTPPYLAGRTAEKDEFLKLLDQDVILDNFLLTGLRGVGKTVLSDELKSVALNKGWAVVGSDMSEALNISEENLALRLLVDLSVITSRVVIQEDIVTHMGFGGKQELQEHKLNYANIKYLYDSTPGLVIDKLKAVFEQVYALLPIDGKKIIFLYDEAQILSDNAAKDQFPLSVLLDLFKSIQKANIPFMLMLVGLPTLPPKLVDARTYAERMFRSVFLEKLSLPESRLAISEPVKDANCPITFTTESIDRICQLSGGYPYFLQFIGREVFDVWIIDASAAVPEQDIINKLDSDFFSGRWVRATDRQRDLLCIVASLDNSSGEFSVSDISAASQSTENPFGGSHINQILLALIKHGLVYKNRYGKYSLSVPLMDTFIKRQQCYEEVFPVVPSD